MNFLLDPDPVGISLGSERFLFCRVCTIFAAVCEEPYSRGSSILESQA